MNTIRKSVIKMRLDFVESLIEGAVQGVPFHDLHYLTKSVKIVSALGAKVLKDNTIAAVSEQLQSKNPLQGDMKQLVDELSTLRVEALLYK